MRLLIVEDEKQICDMVAKSLYDSGYEVDTCYDGEEALECILSEEYDLIVLDLNLPGMDGMEILKELRQENEETKVIILSARGQIADKVEGQLRVRGNDFRRRKGTKSHRMYSLVCLIFSPLTYKPGHHNVCADRKPQKKAYNKVHQ